MTQTFMLPDVGEGLTEAEVTSWKVAPARPSKSTRSSARSKRPSLWSSSRCRSCGEVAELLAEEGETVEVGKPLIRIAGRATTAASPPRTAASRRAQRPQTPARGAGPRRLRPQGRPRQAPCAAAPHVPDVIDAAALGLEEQAPASRAPVCTPPTWRRSSPGQARPSAPWPKAGRRRLGAGRLRAQRSDHPG
ncbi:hypothetical protein [Nesterenkonia pannonica]|uniref:hypothetical protein n=1 Tax=Nesterenkonia pannonica TaxID=1548602 RepID=UPI002164531E|nr:hypothetical protein [Nesterenkonia pannonica]